MNKKNKKASMLLLILGGLAVISILGINIIINKITLNTNAVINREIFPCTDTDGGFDLYLKGTVIGKNMEETDFCMTSDGKIVDSCLGRWCFIMEHFCHHPTNPNLRDGVRLAMQCQKNEYCYYGKCIVPDDLPSTTEENEYYFFSETA